MKKILLSGLFCMSAAALLAQAPTLSLANMPQANSQHNFQDITESALDSVNLGSSGANQSWDFSQLSLDPDGYSQIYLAPAQTPYASEFPTATIGSTDVVNDSSTYAFYKGSSTEFAQLGTAGPDNELTFNPAWKAFNFPFTYNAQFNQNTSLSGTAEGSSVFGTAKTTVKADAWGTVKTKLGAFPALRVSRITELNVTVLFFNIIDRDTATEYWSPQFEAPLFAYHKGSSSIFGQVEFYTYAEVLTAETVATGEPGLSSIDLQIFPNPVVDRSNLRFDLEKGGKATILVSDAQGRQVHSQQLGTISAGNTQTELDFNALPSGTYFIALQVNGQFKGVRKIVKS